MIKENKSGRILERETGKDSQGAVKGESEEEEVKESQEEG